MIRRFNYTNRKALSTQDVVVQLVPSGQGPQAFDAMVNITDRGFPADARVFLEAYYKTSYMRFDYGHVGQIRQPPDRTLRDVDRGNVVFFRLKVVERGSDGNKGGRLLAEVDQVIPRDEGQPDAVCILPVQFVPDMGQQVWRVSIQEPLPVLEVNAFPGAQDFVRTDRLFFSLVFPAALREILGHLLLVDQDYDPDDSDISNWRGKWLLFSKRFFDGPAPRVDEDESGDLRRQWIDDVVGGFCTHFALRDLLVTARGEEKAP